MTTVTIDFDFSNGETDSHDFDAEPGIIGDIEAYAEERASELSEDSDEEVTCDGWEVYDFSPDYGDMAAPAEFSDLEDYAEYCSQCEEHGEAYVLRYADVGDHDFQDEYNGCWSSTEEFVQNLIEECYNLDIPSFVAVDWERTARDVMMDYSEYDGSEGVHIFRC